MLVRYQATGLRKLESFEVFPGKNINWIIGDNGSGKTSFLEGIAALGLGTSFRGKSTEAICREAKQYVVSGRIRNAFADTTIGVQRSRERRWIKKDGEEVSSAWLLAQSFPLLVITADNANILEGGPKLRRKIMDWGVFHVEPNYGEEFREYLRLLKHRNIWLKDREQIINPWDSMLVMTGERLHAQRKVFIQKILPYFLKTLEDLLPGLEIQLEFKAGWGLNQTLLQALQSAWEKDRAYGYSTVGPHRADLSFTVAGRSAESLLSRGQGKRLGLALRLALLRMLIDDGKPKPVVLLDDFASDLDLKARSTFIGYLMAMGLQVFSCVVDAREGFFLDNAEVSTIHINDGVVSPALGTQK